MDTKKHAKGNGIYRGLLFLEGHVADPDLARSLAHDAPASAAPVRRPRPGFDLFRGFGLLGGLRSVDTRLTPEEEFGPSYGNRRAWAREFGRTPQGANTAGQRCEAAGC
jgi:hypothetical protein